MLGKKRKDEMTNEKEDYTHLLDDLDRIIAGDTSFVDVSTYSDAAIGERVNNIIHAFKKGNNEYVMRLNGAMVAIGDNSYVKNMLDQVNSQTSSIKDMENSSRSIEKSILDISESVAHIKENTHEAILASEKSTVNMTDSIKVVNDSSEEITKINEQVQDFQDKINKISEIIIMVKKIASQSNLLALNASIEAARAGEAGKGFAVVAEQVRQLSSNTSESAEDIVKYVTELQTGIATLAASMDDTTKRLGDGNAKVEQSLEDIMLINEQMVTIREEIDSIYDAVDKQSEVTKEFSANIASISDSYETLSSECMSTGNHIFKIGRYIDTVRSDMVRGVAEVTQLDWLRIFEIDHFILTWRVYNNAVDFEHLKITQLNNPTSCKVGKWLAEQKDPQITESTEFKEVIRTHNDVHKYATKSWEAKDSGNVDLALREFQNTLDAYAGFKTAINNLKDRVRAIGITDETEVVLFK